MGDHAGLHLRKGPGGGRAGEGEPYSCDSGCGGGSVMDCCKAVSLAARYEGDVWTNFWEKQERIDFEPVPLCAVVTASGTGSEMNGGAVITNTKKKIKTGRDYPQCNAKLALMDPAYTCSLSKKQTVSGAFDTLSHIMEIYLSAG